MQNLVVFILIITLNSSSYAQEVAGKIMREYIKNDKDIIESIIEYEYRISVQDSFNINGNTVDSISPKYAEFYNEKDKLIRKEYYNRGGETRSAYDNIYRNDTLIYQIGDTLYTNSFVKHEYEYLENNSVKKVTLDRQGYITGHISAKDYEKNTTAEYFLGEGTDTLLTIFHYYDLNNTYRGIERIKHDKTRTIGFSNLDDKDRYAKWLYLDTTGRLAIEEIYNYPNERTVERVKTNLIDSTSTTSKQISFKDSRGNTYKHYWISNRKKFWKVKYYKINYRKD